MEIENIKNVIAAERQDNAEALSRLENALLSHDLSPDLRATYEADIPYRRHLIDFLGYLLACCTSWPTAPPVVSKSDMAREIDDGLDWPECMLADNQSAFGEYICLCSRAWRIEYHDIGDWDSQ